MSHLTFSFLVLLKFTCLVTLFDRKLLVFKNSSNWPFLAFLINVARNVRCDFFCYFRTPCLCTLVYSVGYTLPFEFKTRVCNHFSTLVFELKRFLFNCFPPKKEFETFFKIVPFFKILDFIF